MLKEAKPREPNPHEYRVPTYPEWLQEYSSMPISNQNKKPDAIFAATSIVRSSLIQQRPRGWLIQKGALALEAMHSLPADIKEGGVAYATWMARQGGKGREAQVTEIMGTGICVGVLYLRDWLEIPNPLAEYVKRIFDSKSESSRRQLNQSVDSHDIILAWQKEGASTPLSTWMYQHKPPESFRDKVYQARSERVRSTNPIF